MASSPAWKVYDSEGTYKAACKEIEAAACLLAFYGDGSTIRHQHGRILFTQGSDGDAAESYDESACLIRERLHG